MNVANTITELEQQVGNKQEKGMPEIFPFPISIPERDLTDLRTRLDLTRLPEPQTVPDATQGIELDRLKVLMDAWRLHDWRGLEKRWNAIPHYRTHVDGLDIAFLARPLARARRNPYCVDTWLAGFRTRIREDPRTAHRSRLTWRFGRRRLHVVVPSLPGFGFSERPRERGWNPGRTARAFAIVSKQRDLA